jgi:hypothetical protein
MVLVKARGDERNVRMLLTVLMPELRHIATVIFTDHKRRHAKVSKRYGIEHRRFNDV